MNSDGSIPISFIAGFNRVKALTQDVALIVKAVENSEMVEVIDETKVADPKMLVVKIDGFLTSILAEILKLASF
jgi:hypothetical protein